LRKQWGPAGPPLVWELRAGEGYAPPAVLGDRLVYFHRVGGEEVVECLDATTGRSFWRHAYATAYRDRYGYGNGPRACPVIAAGPPAVVYTLGVEGKLHGLDLATGRVVWQDDTSKRFDVPANFFGVGSSPLLMGDLLLVQVGGRTLEGGGPCLVAYRRTDGQVVWQARHRWGASYASPLPVSCHEQSRVLLFAGGESRPSTGGLLVIDPRDGSVNGQFPFRARRYESVNASNPVCFGDRVFISSSYDTGGVQLRLTKRFGLEQVWRTEALGAHFATPIYREGYLYGIDGAGRRNTALVCVDWHTGKQVWRHAPAWTEPMPGGAAKRIVEFSSYLGSLLAADGHFLLLGELGHLAWVDLTPTGYREITRVRLFEAAETYTAPVLSRGLLYVCQNRPESITSGPDPQPMRLLCYDLRGK
jgi:outer membrane protein assembly factor BamB